MNPTHTIKTIFRTLKFILNHPLNVNKRTKALKRWFFWQIGSRMVRGSVIVDFVNDSRLIVRPGMAAATLNIYCGLHEFEEMGFLLHYLSKDDLFVDVGANVGTYTILAAAAIGTPTIAFEPIPISFRALEENIRINRIQNIVDLKNIGVGNRCGVATFTSSLDAMNHVVEDSEKLNNTVKCKIDTLDSILGGKIPKLLKIDVEGFELPVIEGAQQVLQNQNMEAIIIELNGSSTKYGSSDKDIYNLLIGHGFTAIRYFPLERKLTLIDGPNKFSQNTLFVRSPATATVMCQGSPVFTVLGHQI